MLKRILFTFIVPAFFMLQSSETFGQCNAAYTTIVTPGFTAVQFFDGSTGANFWNWDFGDGTTSTQQNPVHNYASTGTYSVCLVIIGLTGCVDSVCQQVVVPAPGACTASFTVQPVAPGFPGFLFTGTGTGVGPFTYSWNFGDGTILPSSPINTINYLYQVPGTYTVCLTVTDANNCTATSCQTVSTGPSNCPPTFVANILPATGVVLFQDATFGFDPAVSWTWDFGDGTTSSGSGTATHTYAQSGSYNVCLSIITQSGCAGNACSTIVVNVPAACSASFTSSPASAPLTITFTPSIVPSTATHIWDFGDGSLPFISNTPTALQHAYSSSGSYNVCLTVQDGLCTDTFCAAVSVAPATSIAESDYDIRLLAFPNPATETVRFVLANNAPGTFRLELSDNSGRILREMTKQQQQSSTGTFFELPVADLPVGQYHARLISETGVFQTRLTVLR